MSEARSGASRATRILGRAARWLAFGVLATVAVLYYAGSSGAYDRQAPWSAETWEMEGGVALVAVVRGSAGQDEETAPSLMLTCGNGIWSLRYDAGLPAAAYARWLDRSAFFGFDFGDIVIQRSLVFDAMDAVFFGALDGSDPILEALAAGAQLSIATAEPDFPANVFPLRGSATAIREVGATCL